VEQPPKTTVYAKQATTCRDIGQTTHASLAQMAQIASPWVLQWMLCPSYPGTGGSHSLSNSSDASPSPIAQVATVRSACVVKDTRVRFAAFALETSLVNRIIGPWVDVNRARAV
jgi:hypothetical protein